MLARVPQIALFALVLISSCVDVLEEYRKDIKDSWDTHCDLLKECKPDEYPACDEARSDALAFAEQLKEAECEDEIRAYAVDYRSLPLCSCEEDVCEPQVNVRISQECTAALADL